MHAARNNRGNRFCGRNECVSTLLRESRDKKTSDRYRWAWSDRRWAESRHRSEGRQSQRKTTDRGRGTASNGNKRGLAPPNSRLRHESRTRDEVEQREEGRESSRRSVSHLGFVRREKRVGEEDVQHAVVTTNSRIGGQPAVGPTKTDGAKTNGGVGEAGMKELRATALKERSLR
jgi:hypothetical protein